MRSRLLALVLLAAGFPDAMAGDAVSAIDTCIRDIDPNLDVGFERVAARCPDLAPALKGSPWTAWLPHDWERRGNDLSAGGLAELRTLLTRATVRSTAASAQPLHIERVGPLLATLSKGEPESGGWWARFKRWLRELLTPHPQADDPGWLRQLFNDVSVPRAVMKAIVWGALGLVVALGGAIVVNELRVAGVLRPRRRRAAAEDLAPGAARERALARELEAAGAPQQPRLLFELIAAVLAGQDRLPPARALTVRELSRAARLPDAADRARLEALGTACERLRFSDREIPPQALAGVLAGGRELLDSLRAATRPPQAA